MRRAVTQFILACLLVLSAVLLPACGSSGTSGSTSASGDDGGSGATAGDSFFAALPKAEAAVEEVASDAVLMAAGSGGLALAGVPDSWSFTFFSPSTQHPYMVAVDHGTAAEVRDFGKAATEREIRAGVNAAEIKVGAANAVVKAREFGEKSGTLPKNVVVGGSFATMVGQEDLTGTVGVWHVIFASGTDLADAVKVDVDMMSGEVTAIGD